MQLHILSTFFSPHQHIVSDHLLAIYCSAVPASLAAVSLALFCRRQQMLHGPIGCSRHANRVDASPWRGPQSIAKHGSCCSLIILSVRLAHCDAFGKVPERSQRKRINCVDEVMMLCMSSCFIIVPKFNNRAQHFPPSAASSRQSRSICIFFCAQTLFPAKSHPNKKNRRTKNVRRIRVRMATTSVPTVGRGG